LFQNKILDLQPTAAHTFDNVLCGTHGTDHHVHLGFQAYAAHAHGFMYTFLLVDHKFLRHDVQNALIGRNRHCSCRIDHPFHVCMAYFAILDTHNAM